MEQTQQKKRPWVLILGFLVWVAIFLFAIFDKAPPQW